ncbi:MAG: sporulation protein [bacterium]
MIDCQLDQNEIRAGETISGTLTVTPDEDLDLNHLAVEARWFTTGRGDKAEDTVDRVKWDPGSIRSGMTWDENFELEVPKEVPMSYVGELLNINWAVRVDLDIPWAFDEEESASFKVVEPEKAHSQKE